MKTALFIVGTVVVVIAVLGYLFESAPHVSNDLYEDEGN